MNSEKLQKSHLSARVLLCAMLLAFCCAGCGKPREFQGYDGSWWLNAPADQQLGFIEGYVDGYYYEPGEREALRGKSSGLQAAVSEYYQTHSADKEMLAGQVLRRAVETLKKSASAVSASPGEAGQSGELDGQSWLHYSEKERMGFVEGYLNALMPPTSRRVNFPKSAEYYAAEISKRYGIDPSDPDGGEISEEMLKYKIGQVLWEMRNVGKGQKADNP